MLGKRNGTRRLTILAATALLLLGAAGSLYSVAGARITITVDNKSIMTYRGRVGRWLRPEKDTLDQLARRFHTTRQEILSLNGGKFHADEFMFIPFGEDAYNDMLKQGLGRRIMQVDPRRLLWPVEAPLYTSRFGRRFSEAHMGLDVAAATGTPVLAADDGEVVGSSWMGGLGKAVILEHADGKRTVYAHNSELLLNTGERVNRGQIIAFSGSTGRSTGPHIHFEVRYQEVAMNPEDFLPYGYHQSDVILRETVEGVVKTETIPDIRSAAGLPGQQGTPAF